MLLALDTEMILYWCQVGLDGLVAARDEIDALNVFPVADSDTGTNMCLTMESAATAARGDETSSADQVAMAMARGALAGARGSSGTILAQALRGFADTLVADTEAASAGAGSLADAQLLAEALVRATDEAFAAVADPVEGTILSVARAAGDAARRQAADPGATIGDIATTAAKAGREALEDTPRQLDVLREAGVVDAGGRGLTVLLDALETVLVGGHTFPAAGPDRSKPVEPAAPDPRVAPTYEVTYLLDAPADRLNELKAALTRLGDSLVIGGGEPEWKVHVHVDDAAAAVEAGVRAGRPSQITITDLRRSTHEPVQPFEGSGNG